VQGVKRGAGDLSVGGPPKYAYIDAARGWAILLVMTSHVGNRFVDLPYPVKKFTNFGWFGVQMFFLASAVTLALSWSRDFGSYPRKTIDFFIRRFLRIAPMYYAGALLYTLVWPPPAGIEPRQLLRTLLFINAWSPDWIPTTGAWMVVPGGWSIGVEFTFYAIFPILIVVLSTIPRAIVFALIAIVLAAAANAAGQAWWSAYPNPARSEFLYFWFPNQLPVFAIGIVLYHLLARSHGLRLGPAAAYTSIAVAVLACAIAAEHPGNSDRFSWSAVPPQILIATLAFAIFIFTTGTSHVAFFVNRAIRRLGVLSFSCYVLHFLFVQEIPAWTGGLIDVTAGGFRAIAMLALLWLAVVATTFLCAEITHRWIEQPGIRLAHRLTRPGLRVRPVLKGQGSALDPLGPEAPDPH
jgi:peptidoglycan/LPS O-acetylase OafA/YrhL